MKLEGIHHITAITENAQRNVDFYAGTMGLRQVKKTVNQDQPTVYHLFYADADGHPGSDLTFFPWAEMAPPRPGHGLAMEVDLEVPGSSLGFWAERLQKHGVAVQEPETRFGHRVLALADPHGLRLALVEAPQGRPFAPWTHGPVPEARQIRGLFGAQLWERSGAATAQFLTTVLGFEPIATENGWTRYGFANAAGVVDVRETPDARRGTWGVGCVHHLAWRVDGDEHQQAMRARVESAGAQPTPVIDRFWFKSVYFREPGGVLFELATDGPGFAVDEDAAHLGETLVLPPWLEPHRAAIREALPPLHMTR